MRLKTKASRLLCGLLASALCFGSVAPNITAYAVTDTKPVNQDGTTPNWNKPQDEVSDDQRQYSNQGVRLLVSKLKTEVADHEGIYPKSYKANAEQYNGTITYKISGRVEGTIPALEEKYGTGNVEFAYSSSGIYLGYGWHKGTYEYLLSRKNAGNDETVDIVYDGGVFSGYAYITRKLDTTDNANRYVAGATMALYEAIEIERDNTITNDGLDVGEDHRFIGVEVTRNSDSTIDDIRVKKGHAGTTQVYVYQKDDEDKLTVDSYGYVIDKNYNPQDQINDLTDGTWIMKTVEREDTPILYYNLDNLHITTNDVYTKTTVDKVFGSERTDEDSILYAFDKERNVIDATQLNEIGFSIYGFVGDETKPTFEFVGGDYKEIKYSEREKRIVVGTDTLMYHLDKDGNRDSLVDPQTGIAYVEESTLKTTGLNGTTADDAHDDIHNVNNTATEAQQNTKIYVWPVNISYDGSGSTSGNKNGSKTFSKIMGTRIATINADKANEYTTGTYENGTFTHKLYPTLDLFGRTIYYKQSSETYVKGQDTWDYDGDVYTGWKYTDILDKQNLNAYTINDHDELYNGDQDDPFDQSTHYQYSSTQSIKLTVDSNGYIVNGAHTVPVPRRENASFKGWIVSDLTTLTDGQDIYPSWDNNPNNSMSEDMKEKWYSEKAATGETKIVTVTFHANSKGDGDGGSAEFVSGSGDIHSTDNKLYRRMGDAYLIYDKWISGENTPNDPFDDTLVDTVENVANNKNTLTANGKTANDPYSDATSGGMADMLKRVALGDYILEEISAPLGYVKGLPVGVTVNYSSEVQLAEMHDTTIKVELVKLDAPENDLTKYQYYVDSELQTKDGTTPVTVTEHKSSYTYGEVTGAKIAIKGADSTSKAALSSWAKVTSHPRVTTKVDTDGYTYIEVVLDTALLMEGFPAGNYIATEVETPSGAVTMKVTTFTVNEETGVQSINFTDDHTKVEVEKYYLGSGDAIKHLDNARRAQLALINEDGEAITTWWTDDLLDYKSSGAEASSASLLSKIATAMKNLVGGSSDEETTNFETQFKTNFKKDKTFTEIGWTVTRTAELLSGATDDTQVWLLSDGTKVTCSKYSAPDDAPEAFKEAYKEIDHTVTNFSYEEKLTATKDEDRTINDSNMFWNCSNGSMIHVAAIPDESNGNVIYSYEFQYNYKVENGLVMYDKEDGVHRIDYLPNGTYKIKEITAPDGFVLAEDKTITVNGTSDVQRYMYENKGRELTIAKYGYVNEAYYAGNESGNTKTTEELSKAAVVPGFEFKVYYSENQIADYENAFGDNKIPDGAVLKDSFVTGTDGTYTEKDYKNHIITYEQIGSLKPHSVKDVENGYYYVVETKAVEGYSTAKVKEAVVTDAAAATALKIDIVDNVIPLKVKVIKKDKDGNNLSGAGFTITNKTLGGTNVGYMETDENGEGSIIIQNPYAFNADGTLKLYTYELSETKAPAGYTVSDKTYTFTADAKNLEYGKNPEDIVSLISIENGCITYVDTPTVISITKKDFDTLDEVPGTGFTVYEAELDGSGNWIVTDDTKADWSWITSKGHPEHQLNDLSAGKTYALVETKVPTGYTLADTIFFTINNEGTAIEKTWTGTGNGHAITFNTDENGKIVSADFASRQILGAKLICTNVETGDTNSRWLEFSEPMYLTRDMVPTSGTYNLDVSLAYSDGTSEIVETTSVAVTEDAEYPIAVKFPLSFSGSGGNLTYSLTDESGNELAAWSVDGKDKTTYRVSLNGDDGSRLSYVNTSSTTFGKDSSAVYAGKIIGYSLTYAGDGNKETEILIAPSDNATIAKIDNQSAAAYGPKDDGYYHIKGSKDGGTLSFTAQVNKNATGYVTQQVIVNGRTLERINPIAMNKDTGTSSWSKLVIANEVNGSDATNDAAEFTYELTLTKNGTDKALDGQYDWRTRSQSGKFTSFGKNKTFEFTLTGNNFLVIELPEGAQYSVKQLSAPDGFKTTTAGTLSGNTSTDDYKCAYATFKNERSKSESSIFEEGHSYIVTEILRGSEDREISKYGFSINEGEAAYNFIVLNKQTEVWFSKTSWTDCEEVPGAKCTLYEQNDDDEWVPVNINGEELSWTSTDEPKKFKGTLEVGKTYRYVEVGPPDGYAYTEAVEFTVSEDGRIDKVVMRDKLIDVKFAKTDFAGNEVEGADVELWHYNKETGAWDSMDAWTSKAGDENKHEIEGKLNSGETYRYHEAAAPDGYAYSEDIEFTIDEKGKVTNAHYIDENGDIIIYDKLGYPMDDIKVVNTDGVHGVPTYIYGGDILTEKGGALYKITEEGEEQLIPGTEGFRFQIDVIDNVIQMKDDIIKTTFTKTDFAGNEVEGADVELWHYNKETGAWDSMDAWTSKAGDENKHEIEGKLNSGETYRYHEAAAPDGYAYSEDIEFTIDEKGKVTNAHYIDENGTTIIYDKLGYPMDDIQVVTTDGVSSYIYGDDILTEKDGALYKITEEGEEQLIPGTEGFRIQIDVIDNVIQMKDDITKVTFTKENFAGEEVPGAEVEIKHYNKETKTWDSIDTWTSGDGDDNKHEIEGKLTPGETYRYHEEGAPDGYYYSEDIEFTLDEKGKVTGAHYIDKNENTIAYDKNGYPLEVVTVKTNEDGTRTFYYDGEEVTENDGTLTKGDVVLIEDIKVDIPVVDNVVKMLDAPIKVKLVKARANTNDTVLLSGGIFSIAEKVSGKVVKENFVINETLDLTAELRAGVTYLLKEITAPDGFEKADDVEFSIPTYNTDETITVHMEDPRKGLTPSYTMDKVRVTPAPEKLSTKTFGFYHGDEVSYKVTIKNTGDMQLTMTVADALGYDDNSEETNKLRSYFTTPVASDAVFYNYDVKQDVKGEENGAAGRTVEKKADGSTVITLETGAMAEIIYTATVLDTAPEYLAPAEADDKNNDNDGYRNTATVKDVTGKDTNKKPGDEDKTYTKEDFPELDDKKDTADTPVQELRPSYEMSKERVTDAPIKSGTDKYGFFHHSVVDYDVTVRNTGEMALELSVTDRFDDTIANYFSVPFVKNVKFYNADGTENSNMGTIYYHADSVTDNNGNEIGKNKVRIGIEVGGYAVVTYRATVSDEALENLSNAAKDDGLGYLNTAHTTDVIGKYYDSKGDEHTVDKNKEYPVDPKNPDGEKYKPLEDKEDTANTPVQIPVEYTPSYTLTKRRVDDAKLKGGTTNKYGFNRGDKVTYEVVVTNTGDLPIVTYVDDQFEDSIKKYFNELQIESITFKVTSDNSEGSGENITENGCGIGFTKAHLRIPVGQKAILLYSAIVADTTPENLSNSAPDDGLGYLNIAKTSEPHGETPPGPDGEPGTDIPLEPKEDKANTPVKVPVPGYEMNKVRVTDAPIKSGTIKYGFFRGDTVTYKVTVKNTGDMDLKMLVDDAFTEHPEYFSTPVIDHVKFFDTEGAESSKFGELIERDGTGIGKDKAYISLKIGGTAEFYFTSVVAKDAVEYLAPTTADDKSTADDGYTNTATTTEVTGTYTDGNGEHTVDKDTEYPVNPENPDGEKYKPLEDKEDTADTPVQVPKELVPRYDMKKERITDAPLKEDGKYGFRAGDVVTYDVTVSNTGDIPISTLVTDEFEETAKTYFEDLKITGIKFLDEEGKTAESAGHELTLDGNTSDKGYWIGSQKAYIYVYTGCKAVVTYTAKVSDKAIELLSNYPNEDDYGYVNTAKTTNTHGEPPEGGDKPPLEPKEDTEKTPVQTPDPKYEMSKERVTPAPIKSEGKYGFYRGDVVTYKVTVNNTGSMQLTMDVEDHFDDDVAAYFSIPVLTGVDFFKADGTQSADAGKKNSSEGNAANITIEVGCYSELTYTATVLENAPEYLAPAAADNKNARDDGYGNTATTTHVLAKYIDGKGVEHTFTKDDYPSDDTSKPNPLEDKKDTADTPVQEKESPSNPNYTLTKERVTPATVKVGKDGKYGFFKGEKAFYKVVVENTGDIKIETTVSDEFDEKIASYFENLKIEAPANGSAIVFTDRAGNVNANLGQIVERSGMGIGTDKIRIQLEVGGRAEIYYSATVSDKAEELLASSPFSTDDPTGYKNIAKAKDTTTVPPDDSTHKEELPPKEDDEHTPVQEPKPSYTMSKERITLAPEKSDGKYGFRHASTVDYRVTVTNTGETVLTMSVDDRYDTLAKDYFSTPLISKITFTDGSLIETEGAGIGTDHANITLNPGGEAVFVYTAKVLDSAPESLSLKPADDGLGYLNIATVKDVTSTHETPDGEKHTTTEKDYPDDDNPLKPKEDDAHTPVQVPTPDYALTKTRVSEAPKKNSTKYGFYRGSTVTYEVVVTNTGDMDLEMLVNDAFDTAIAGYFQDLKITNVKFADKNTGAENAAFGKLIERDGTGIGTTKAYISLNKGGKAIFTYTAKVSSTAPENLSNAAKDDGLGYLNTATTTEVVGTYENGDGEKIKVTKDDFDTLKDKEDTAHTPVQKTTSGGGGDGGGGHVDTSARIVIYKYDSETSKSLSGATFEIYYPDGSLYKTVTTGSTGEATVRIYTTGTYSYKEITAPDGYELDSEVRELKVTNYTTYTARVANTKEPEVPVTPVTPETPEKPSKGKITVSYNTSANADGNGWFDSNGQFHKFPTPEKFKTGDDFNMTLATLAALTGLALAGFGAYGVTRRRKKEEQ